MCDPLVNANEYVMLDPFRKAVTEEYEKNKSATTKYPKMHYTQLNYRFKQNTLRELLEKLEIPIKETKTTIIGGFTGKFASYLEKIGMKVTFTDPLEDWVKNAASLKLEAYKYSAEQIPSELVKKTELFATFECYYPMTEVYTSNQAYTIMRFLTSKYGILFAESKMTRDQISKDDWSTPKMTNGFIPYKEIYKIETACEQKDGLRFYHFRSNPVQRALIKLDLKVMKNLYDNYPIVNNVIIPLDKKTAVDSASTMGWDLETWLTSIKRIIELSQMGFPKKQSLEDGSPVFVCSKLYLLKADLLSML